MRRQGWTRVRAICAMTIAAVGLALPMSVHAGSAACSRPAVVTVTINNFAFSPATITIKHGTTVLWKNLQSVPHTVTADNGSFSSGVLQKGKTYRHTFTTAGTITYHCKIHPFMHGTVKAT